MGKIPIFALGFLFLVATFVHAETKAFKSPGISGLKPAEEGFLGLKPVPKGLLGVGRFSLQHTLGISFRSGVFGGLNQYYLSTITYKAAEPLTIQAQVGIQNTLYGNSTYGTSRRGNARIIVPRIGVLYQPRSNIRIEFQFSNLPLYNERFGWGGHPY